jgi:hypothetical protein
MIDNGFFSSPKAFGSIKAEALKTAPELSDAKIRKGLKNAENKLTVSGTGRGTKYMSVSSA